MTVADITRSLDARLTRRKHFLRVGKENCRFLQSEFKEAKSRHPCNISFGYGKTNIEKGLRGQHAEAGMRQCIKEALSPKRHEIPLSLI